MGNNIYFSDTKVTKQKDANYNLKKIMIILFLCACGIAFVTCGELKNKKDEKTMHKEYVTKDSDGYEAYLDSFYVEQHKADSLFYVDKQTKLDALDSQYNADYSRYLKKINAMTDSVFEYMNLEEIARTNSDDILFQQSIRKQDYFLKQCDKIRNKHWKKIEKYQEREDSIRATKPIQKEPLSKEMWLTRYGNRNR